MKLLNKSPLILFIYFTNSNILCTITNIQGKTLTWINIGTEKVKGTRKITTSSIYNLVKTINNFFKVQNNSSMYIRVKGTNKNKTTLIKQLKLVGLVVLSIQEQINIPYGGCKKYSVRKL